MVDNDGMRLSARVVLPARVCVLVLALTPALAACGEDPGPSAGDVVAARSDDQFVDGRQSRLNLPTGQLVVNLGDATDTVGATDTRQREDLTAAAGSTFLPITWRYDVDTYGDLTDYVAADGNPTFTLVTDGADYRLPPPNPSGVDAESFYVVVAGDGEDPTLEVEFDGVTQTLDLATGDRDEGQAAGLYDLKTRTAKTRSCADDVTYDKEPVRPPGFNCTTTTAARLPYAAGEWAADGRSWVVVSVTTSLLRWDRVAADGQSGAVYLATGVDSTFRLGKLEPVRVLDDTDNSTCPDPNRGCVRAFDLVFDVPADSEGSRNLRIDQDYQFDLFQVWGGGSGKETIEESLRIATRVNAY